MQSRYADIIDHIRVWSQQTEAIQGIVVIGSQARDSVQADQWSDLDLMVLAQTPDTFLTESQWLDRFGNVTCAYNAITPLHFTTWDWSVKRVLLEDNRDIDFSILPYDHVDEVLAVNQSIIAKGYQIIYDAHAPLLTEKIRALVAAHEEAVIKPPTETELHNTVNDLLYHIIWVFKKILRKELWVAVSTIDQHTSHLLLQLIEWHIASVTPEPYPITYDGRFLEVRAAGEIIGRLRGCFARYDQADAIETLGHLVDFAQFISQAIAGANDYTLDTDQFVTIRSLYHAMKAQAG